jgi:hypothetical protein
VSGYWMNTGFLVGIALIVAGCAEAFWAVRPSAPRAFALQGLMLAELGMMAVAISIISNVLAQVLVVAALGIGALVSMAAFLRLLRKERRERERISHR